MNIKEVMNVPAEERYDKFAKQYETLENMSVPTIVIHDGEAVYNVTENINSVVADSIKTELLLKKMCRDYDTIRKQSLKAEKSVRFVNDMALTKMLTVAVAYIEKLTQQLTKVEADKRDFAEDLNSATLLVNKLEKENSKLTEEVAKLQTENENVVNDASRFEDMVDSLEKNNVALNTKVEELTEKLNTTVEHAKRLNSEAEDYMRAAKEYENKFKAAEQKIEALTSKLNTVAEEAKGMNADLEAAMQEAKRYEKELEASEKRNEKLSKMIAEQHKLVSSAADRLVESTKAIQKISDEGKKKFDMFALSDQTVFQM